MSEDNDPRSEELSSLSAIFPEIQYPNPKDQYTIALELPVTPSDPVTVFFPAVADNSAANGENGQKTAGPVQPPVIDSHKVAHFPPLRLEITFGPKYPDEEPPKASISTSPPGLPDFTIKRLENDATRIWEETGMDIAGYAYIDHIQQATSNVFGLVDDSGTLMVDSSHKIAILDYDIQARQAKFDRGTYECGVCLG
jgi:E3 ubiquitin-protein ligase RNF14